METFKQDIKDSMQTNNKQEGAATKAIEKVTATIPSATWLVLGGGAIVSSIVLKAMGKHVSANFVGQWAPTFLMLGLYNKMVKLLGSDRNESMRATRLAD
ncbi:MAG TPA: hypothetical protein VGC41_18600 [Kofleriaceae bacterium]